mgnify:CR=1 FL=1
MKGLHKVSLLTLMTSNKGGHVYKSSVKRGRKIYWTCREKNKKCLSKAVTNGIYVIQWTGEHNHEKILIQLHNYDRKYTVNDHHTRKYWERKDGMQTILVSGNGSI